MFKFQGQTYERPILRCRGCMTPVFKLPEDIDKNERIVDTLMQKAIPIHPQPKPQPKDKRVCATCGCVWHIQGNELPFVITEDLTPTIEARIREIVREEIAEAKVSEQQQFLEYQRKNFGQTTGNEFSSVTISATGSVPLQV